MVKFLMNPKLKQDDGVTDQSGNRSRTTEDDSERVAHRVKVQEKVQTTWLFDTGTDAHVMPKYVWEQFGEPTLQNNKGDSERSKRTRPWSHGRIACQRFHWENQSSVRSGGCTRRETMPSERNESQSEGVHVHVDSTREFPHTVKRRRKSNDVTRRKTRYSQSCVHVEAKRCIGGNLVLKRDLENVRRKLRNLKTDKERENAEGEMTALDRITHEGTEHATYDPRCETCLKVRGLTTPTRSSCGSCAF